MNRPFVLLSTQRSGSTWVVDMLNSHPSVVAYSELLLEGARGRPQWGGAKDLLFWNDYYAAAHARGPDRPRHDLLYAYLDQVYAPRADCRAIGFKLMYGQFGAYPELLEYLKSREVAVVHLIRENLLDVLLSKEAAVERDVFHSRGKERLEDIKIHLDTRQLLQRLEAQRRDVERMRKRFADSGLPCLEVGYEALVADTALFDRILEFLSVPPAQAPLGSSLQKLNQAPRADLIANYAAVAAVLRGTPFESLLR